MVGRSAQESVLSPEHDSTHPPGGVEQPLTCSPSASQPRVWIGEVLRPEGHRQALQGVVGAQGGGCSVAHRDAIGKQLLPLVGEVALLQVSSAITAAAAALP